MFFFSAFCNDRLDKCDHFLVQLMCRKDRLDHLSFRNFVRSCLDHDHFLFCRRNRQRKVGYFFLCCRRVKYELSVNKTYLCCGDRSVKRNIGNTCCDCRAKHRRQFRAAVLINRHDKIFQCHVIPVIFREQRSHRPVDDTAGQDRILRCFSLSFVKSSRDLADRI